MKKIIAKIVLVNYIFFLQSMEEKPADLKTNQLNNIILRPGTMHYYINNDNYIVINAEAFHPSFNFQIQIINNLILQLKNAGFEIITNETQFLIPNSVIPTSFLIESAREAARELDWTDFYLLLPEVNLNDIFYKNVHNNNVFNYVCLSQNIPAIRVLLDNIQSKLLVCKAHVDIILSQMRVAI